MLLRLALGASAIWGFLLFCIAFLVVPNPPHGIDWWTAWALFTLWAVPSICAVLAAAFIGWAWDSRTRQQNYRRW